MYYKVDEKEMGVLNKAEELTGTCYGREGEFYPIDQLLNVISDLIVEYRGLEEQYEDYKLYVADNYKKVIPNEEYGE